MVGIARCAIFHRIASLCLLASVISPFSSSATVAVTAAQEETTAFVATLPDGVEPNPPDPGFLKKSNLTWNGEYVGDKKGNPLLDEAGKPVPMLYNSKGKRQRITVSIPKPHPAFIADGMLVVDGWIGKARLNYDIHDLHYLYISAPGIGTVAISPTPFPGSTEETSAFTDTGLTLKLSGHEIQLVTAKPILGKKGEQSAYVKLDDGYTANRRSPVLGYGRTLIAPYVWPGGFITDRDAALAPPALPADMLPTKAKPICLSQASKDCQTKTSDLGSPASNQTH